jgi:hypothetical protein
MRINPTDFGIAMTSASADLIGAAVEKGIRLAAETGKLKVSTLQKVYQRQPDEGPYEIPLQTPTASRSQATRKAVPPKGVIIPNQRTSVSARR